MDVRVIPEKIVYQCSDCYFLEQIDNWILQCSKTGVFITEDFQSDTSWLGKIHPGCTLGKKVEKPVSQKEINDSWALSPDRMGGQYTDEEVWEASRERW